jgi:hypothetical protein
MPPGAGAEGTPYLPEGDFEASLSYRYSRSDEHYSGIQHQLDRNRLAINVVNEQHLLDLRLTYALSDRWSLSASEPFLIGTWSLPLPMSPTPGPRREQDAMGFGDLTLTPRVWLWDPSCHAHGNVQVGLGLKVPTGADDLHDRFPDLSGGNVRTRPVDVSIQPGDGGWGAVADLLAFRDWGPFRFSAGGSYLFNPRESNRTPSTASALLGLAAAPPEIRYNSVPDQYLVQAGVSAPLGRGFGAGIVARWEGVPPRDRFGGNDGFRRPGYSVSAGPALSWTVERTTIALSVPRTLMRNRQRDARGASGDATFADFAVFLSVTVRF